MACIRTAVASWNKASSTFLADQRGNVTRDIGANKITVRILFDAAVPYARSFDLRSPRPRGPVLHSLFVSFVSFVSIGRQPADIPALYKKSKGLSIDES